LNIGSASGFVVDLLALIAVALRVSCAVPGAPTSASVSGCAVIAVSSMVGHW
jgi:hypothetical protein